MKPSEHKKGRPVSTGQPKTTVPALQLGKYLRRQHTTPARDAQVAALARVLAILNHYPHIRVLAVHHAKGNAPLIVIEYGFFAWSLPGKLTRILGRGDGRVERYEAAVDGVRLGWEFNPARHPRHFN